MNTKERELASRTMREVFDKHGKAGVATACGVKTPSVYSWEVCPPHHVLTLEAFAGVPRSFLRPDLYPGKLNFDEGGR